MDVSPAVLPDLLRTLAIPVFGWAAYTDVRTRRVANRLWPPLVVLGVLALALEAGLAWLAGDAWLLALTLSVSISLLALVPLAALLWRAGAGLADVQALLALAIVYPTPSAFGGATLALEPLSVTVLTNAIVVALLYPLALIVRNALSGRFTPAMVVARPVAVDRLTDAHGRLLESSGGLDLDALAAYLEYRDCSLEELQARPAHYRSNGAGDPWNAAAFLEATDRPVYGATPETLRDGLEAVTATDSVWIAPGLPFLVPVSVGLVIALAYGNLLVGVVF